MSYLIYHDRRYKNIIILLEIVLNIKIKHYLFIRFFIINKNITLNIFNFYLLKRLKIKT